MNVPERGSTPPWFVPGVMENGAWAIGGSASPHDRSKLLLDIARSAISGAPLFGDHRPIARKVHYLNYSKRRGAIVQDLTRAGVEIGTGVEVLDSQEVEVRTLNRIGSAVAPDNAVILVDGLHGSAFGGRDDVLAFLEYSLGDTPHNVCVVVSLPEDLANSRSVRFRNERFLQHTNLLWVSNNKGQLNVDVFSQEAANAKYFCFDDKWLPTASRNALNPTEAAIVAYLRNQDGFRSNLEIQQAIESNPELAAVSDRFQKVLQRARSDGAIRRDEENVGMYCDPLRAETGPSLGGAKDAIDNNSDKMSEGVKSPLIDGKENTGSHVSTYPSSRESAAVTVAH